MVHGVWCRVQGVGCMVYGVGCLVYGVGCIMHGAGCIMYGVGCKVYGLGYVVHPNPGSPEREVREGGGGVHVVVHADIHPGEERRVEGVWFRVLGVGCRV